MSHPSPTIRKIKLKIPSFYFSSEYHMARQIPKRWRVEKSVMKHKLEHSELALIHQATIATFIAVFTRTINKLLFAERNQLARLLEMLSFKCSCRWKGPARTTLTLKIKIITIQFDQANNHWITTSSTTITSNRWILLRFYALGSSQAWHILWSSSQPEPECQ